MRRLAKQTDRGTRSWLTYCNIAGADVDHDCRGSLSSGCLSSPFLLPVKSSGHYTFEIRLTLDTV